MPPKRYVNVSPTPYIALCHIRSGTCDNQTSYVPFGRVLPHCSHWNSRTACWGGFSFQTGGLVTDVATYWSGIHIVEVEQSLQLDSSGSIVLQTDADVAALHRAWELAQAQDKLCSKEHGAVCG